MLAEEVVMTKAVAEVTRTLRSESLSTVAKSASTLRLAAWKNQNPRTRAMQDLSQTLPDH
jgi:hypothetical protein